MYLCIHAIECGKFVPNAKAENELIYLFFYSLTSVCTCDFSYATISLHDKIVAFASGL